MSDTIPLLPHAMWTLDCQGKQDFDGPLLRISTRYWPGPTGGGSMIFDSATGEIGTVPYGHQPSANSAIHLCIGPKESEDDFGPDYRVWREQDFSAPTEAEVKAQVEAWVRVQMEEMVILLGGPRSFRKP